MKFIKKFFVVAVIMIMICTSTIKVEAASFTVSKSTSSVESGGSFTITISSADCEGKYTIAATNGTVSTSSIWTSGTVKVVAGKEGTCTVTVTAADVTAYDETAVTGKKTVSVAIRKKEEQQSVTPARPAVAKSSENRLSSITVSSGKLSPAFKENTTAYTVSLTNETETITIAAKAKDQKATIQGTGKKSLNIGENNFMITCVAENGARKTYTVSVNVIEKPTVFIDVDNQKLGVINDYGRIDIPKNFAAQEIKIGNDKINCLVNDKLQMTLVALQNDNDIIQFYMYDTKKQEVLGLYQPIKIDGKLFYIVDNSTAQINELTETIIRIGDVDIKGWQHPDSQHVDYTLLYLMNSQGEKLLYSYEASEKSIQKYTADTVEEDHSLKYIAVIIALIIVCLIQLIIILKFKRKN